MRQFTISDEYEGRRIGALRLRSNKKLETPAMFYGHYPTDAPFWMVNGRDTPVVINAYHMLKEPRFEQRVRKGVRNYLYSIKYRPYLEKIRKRRYHLGPVLFDSGGYSFMNKSDFSVDPRDILDLQQTSKADIAVTLDWPIDPNKLGESQRWKHLKISIKNARIALERRTDQEMLLMPVVHGWNEESIKHSVKSLMKIEKDTGNEFSAFSIGSIVPHSFTNNIDKAIRLILLAKKVLPADRPIHVLGIGGLSTIPLALMLGIDMFDSSTYVLSAIHRRYFLPNFTRIGIEDLKKITCECPVCSTIKKKELLYPRKEPLALHNFFILEKEFKMLIKSVKNNTFEQTIEKHLSQYNKMFSICKKLKSEIME